MNESNRMVVLATPIDGVPRADNFRIVERPVAEPGAREFLVRHIYVSLDPYQRSAIGGMHLSSDGALAIDAMPAAETIGRVVTSQHTDFRPGDYVRHFGGWQEYSLSDGTQAVRVDPQRAPLSTYLGVLGMPGLTAWASMIRLAAVQPGQSVLVSAASGPVGSMVGQIARQRGARAFGIAGSAEKCAFVIDELGFEHCIDYRNADVPTELARIAPDGFDIYHDNVGGQMLTDALRALRPYGTVILCGLISQYNDTEKGRGFDLAPAIIKRAVMKGLVVYDYEESRAKFMDLVAPWLSAGKIAYREDRVSGIENTGAHFARLMSGRNFGKALVVLED